MYKTNSIDEAAYVYSQGLNCSIVPLNDSYAEFTFSDDNAEKLAEKYRKGDVVMKLSHYQSSRTQLKHLSSKELSVAKQKASGTLWSIK